MTEGRKRFTDTRLHGGWTRILWIDILSLFSRLWSRHRITLP